MRHIFYRIGARGRVRQSVCIYTGICVPTVKQSPFANNFPTIADAACRKIPMWRHWKIVFSSQLTVLTGALAKDNRVTMKGTHKGITWFHLHYVCVLVSLSAYKRFRSGHWIIYVNLFNANLSFCYDR